jgi:hypothetical protein
LEIKTAEISQDHIPGAIGGPIQIIPSCRLEESPNLKFLELPKNFYVCLNSNATRSLISLVELILAIRA